MRYDSYSYRKGDMKVGYALVSDLIILISGSDVCIIDKRLVM